VKCAVKLRGSESPDVRWQGRCLFWMQMTRHCTRIYFIKDDPETSSVTGAPITARPSNYKTTAITKCI